MFVGGPNSGAESDPAKRDFILHAFGNEMLIMMPDVNGMCKPKVLNAKTGFKRFEQNKDLIGSYRILQDPVGSYRIL